MAGGRPSKYTDETAEQVKRMCRLGLTDDEIAEVIGVAKSTLSRWKSENAEFSEAIKQGKVFADANVANSLYNRAIGYSHKAVKIFQYMGAPIEVEYTEHYPPDPVSAIFWLCNRQPKKWKRNQQTDQEGDDHPQPVKVTVSVVNAAKTDADT